MMGLTEAVAEFIQARTLQDVPADALGKAKKAIADTFAVILAGAGSEVAPPLLRYAEQTGECGIIPILGTGRTASPEMAALVNGTFGHALDFDDVLSMMPAHPSAVILPALCAGARLEKLPGKALIEAYVIGIEVGGKIGQAITVGHYHRGFHGTGTLAIFSALGALAKCHRLDVATTQTAFGIASSLASGLQRNFGTMTKPLHTGWASRAALAAVDLARSGFTAAPDILEAPSGFFAAYGVEASRPETAIDRLGNPWVIVDPGLALKRFPCCYASHRGMDGVLHLRRRLGLNAENLKDLHCRMPPGGMRVLIYPDPKTGLEGKFSLQYALAAGILDGEYSLWSFTDEAVNLPPIRDLLARMYVSEDPRCAGNDPLLETRSSGSRGYVEVEAVRADGRRDTVRVDHAPGHPSRELTWEDISAKFMDCAAQARIDLDKAEQALSILACLETCPDIGEVVTLLHEGRAVH
jgi:2-methylcitrate dehydratase PrpD